MLHGGYDPRGSRLTGPWLSMTYVLARPLAAARVPPDLVTLAGLVVAGGVAGLTAAGGRWAVPAAGLVVASGLLDNLDGAVAVLEDRATRWGYVLDSAVDRCADMLYLVAFWRAGAPGGLCTLAGFLTFSLEYVRARAGAAGMTEVGVVTVWERPSRVIVTALFLAGVGVYADARRWATAGALASATLGAVGCAQLALVVRRRLR